MLLGARDRDEGVDLVGKAKKKVKVSAYRTKYTHTHMHTHMHTQLCMHKSIKDHVPVSGEPGGEPSWELAGTHGGL